MKATELMIGDWVQFHHLGIKKVSDVAPRCKSINVDYIGQIEGVYVGVNDGIGQCGIKTVPNDYEKETGHHMMHTFAIEPIPITEEILEKNGFEQLMNEGERVAKEFGRTPKPTGVWMYSFGEFDSVSYVQEGHFMRIKFMQGGQSDIDNIHYVHQLQHTLHLFGIEKDINL